MCKKMGKLLRGCIWHSQEICEENRNDTETLADRVQEQLNAVILDIEVHLDELKRKKGNRIYPI